MATNSSAGFLLQSLERRKAGYLLIGMSNSGQNIKICTFVDGFFLEKKRNDFKIGNRYCGLEFMV